VLQSIINGNVRESIKDLTLQNVETQANQISTRVEN
jgi:hypothetical protein